ncbi:MAG: hypothetical protein ABIW94_12655 [Gemmatimonadaceae bacterium]
MNVPSVGSRLLVAVAIASAAALMPLIASTTVGVDNDFGVFWFAARALLQGRDPYTLIGPGFEYEEVLPFRYPITSAIAAIPFAGFQEVPATIVFVWVSTCLLAYALTAEGWSRLPVFLSVPFIIALQQAQWSPLLTAAACLPALAWIVTVKPNIGLAILAGDQSGRVLKVAALGGGALALIGLLFVPTWPVEWFASLQGPGSLGAPLFRPWGWVAILALLRWRRPEARLLFILACVPQTPAWYEALPLFLVAVTLRETLFLAVVSSAPVAFEMLFGRGDGFLRMYPNGLELMLFAYLPAIIITIRRPNQGALPDWIPGVFRLFRPR